jgi:hypothetical protein
MATPRGDGRAPAARLPDWRTGELRGGVPPDTAEWPNGDLGEAIAVNAATPARMTQPLRRAAGGGRR